MGYQEGTCVQLHTLSTRWGLKGVLVCNFTHHLRDLQDGVSGGYLCATSHIIYEMGSEGSTCVQLHTSSMRSTRWGIRGYLCATSHIIYEMGYQGVLVCNFTHHLQDGVSEGYLCATSHIIYEMGYQGGTCVQLHTSSMRWGLREVLVCSFTHHL